MVGHLNRKENQERWRQGDRSKWYQPPPETTAVAIVATYQQGDSIQAASDARPIIELFAHRRLEILRHKQMMILDSMSPENIQQMGDRDKAGILKYLYDIERLELGQATSISVSLVAHVDGSLSRL